jgi:hypothetical protein
MTPKRPSDAAVECARIIANYCTTRFPGDTPPSELLDVPWFAEKVQKYIDQAFEAGLQEASRRREQELTDAKY